MDSGVVDSAEHDGSPTGTLGRERTAVVDASRHNTDVILAALAAVERPQRSASPMSGWSWTTWLALAAVLGCTVIGAWLTAEAVVAGDVTAMVLRFGAASLLGAYAYAVARSSVPKRRF